MENKKIQCCVYEVIISGWPMLGGELVQKGDKVIVDKQVAGRVSIQCGVKLKLVGECEVDKLSGVYYEVVKQKENKPQVKIEDELPSVIENKVSDRSMESNFKSRKKSKK